MNTGDHVQDGSGRKFQVGQLLGRGSWGKCYLVREDKDGTEWVLKVPLTEEELPREPPRLAEACREIAREQGRLLEEAGNEALVDVESRFIADDGSPAILMPRYPDTLERRMSAGCTFLEVLETMTGATESLAILAPIVQVHGSIKPANLMINKDGEVRLMDPVTPTLRRYQSALSRREGYLGSQYLPQEVRADEEGSPLTEATDTYAMAMVLYRAIMADEHDQAQVPPLPDTGLDKIGLVVLKDRIHNRLKAEPSNPRFQTRLSDRAAAIINRAVSVETSPSPPYRFNRLPEFRQRLDEVTALVHPTVTHVGKLLLNRPPASETFNTDEDIRFSCTIGASLGVETHEEIACGIAVFDAEQNTRLRDIACSYTVDRHPSGRFRFSFRIAEIIPGQYTVRVAYTIRDSGHEPATAEGDFTVLPAPGYVPPRHETERQPIPMDRTEDASEDMEDTVTMAHLQPDESASPDETGNAEAPVDTGPAPTPTDSEVVPLGQVASSPDPVPIPIGGDGSNVGSEPATNEGGIDDPDVDEPEYAGAGRWSELPLPASGGQDVPTSTEKATPTAPKEPVERGPIGQALGRALDLVRSDAYVLFLGGAGLVILVLLAALWLLPSS